MATALQSFNAVPTETVDIGTPIAFRRFGRGPAVVFVHGWPLNGATYRGLVRELAREFTCFVPDLPGAGDSPWDPRIRNVLKDGGDVVVRFVDALDLDRCALVGHDSGGTMARFAAAKLGSRVSALVLTNTELPYHVPSLVLLFQRLGALPGAKGIFRLLLGWRAYRASRFGFGGCFLDTSLIEGEFFDACVRPMLDDMEGTLRTLRHADFSTLPDLSAAQRKIGAPTVCIWGARDPFFPLAEARQLPQQLPNCRGFHVVEQARLLVHEEAPEEVARLMLPLLRETAAPARAALAMND